MSDIIAIGILAALCVIAGALLSIADKIKEAKKKNE
ncbi:hypothetical protein LCGC14_1215170 [marine sediment metagenome]|uniref:Uncharacterized protein n=1 Tax=marine sediment metagenome TaxID=412755 RepID=A0A0F9M0F2_9ZZZZ